jgi:hypothetical protein
VPETAVIQKPSLTKASEEKILKAADFNSEYYLS